MHKKLDFGLTLCLTGNIMFLLFAGITYIYYKLFFKASQGFIKFLEFADYMVLIFGFMVFAVGLYFIWTTARMRLKMKSAIAFYILMEAVLMFCELHSYLTRDFYHPYSTALAIIHSVLSAAVCFSLIELDPYKKCLEVFLIICIAIILTGMLGIVFGIRLYFGILINAVAYSVLFIGLKRMLNKEMIEVDCHGDRARVAEYRGFFDDNDNEKTDAQRAKEQSEQNNKE